MALHWGPTLSDRDVFPGAKGDVALPVGECDSQLPPVGETSEEDREQDSGDDHAVDADGIEAEESVHGEASSRYLAGHNSLCSCIRRGAPNLKSRLHDPEKISTWIQNKLDVIKNPAIVAVMLPAEAELKLKVGQQGVHREMKIQASTRTSFCNANDARNLYVVSLDPPLKDESVCAQLLALRGEIAGATQDVRPANGPWVWPMHRDAVSTAIMASFLLPRGGGKDQGEAEGGMLRSGLQSFYVSVRQFLWTLRIIPPPGGPVLEKNLASHHGAAVSFAFFWTNLYIRGLWLLMVPTLVFYFAGSTPVNGPSMEGLPWNFLQVWTLLWCLVLSHADKIKMGNLTSPGSQPGQLGSHATQSSHSIASTRGARKWIRKRKADLKVLLWHSSSSSSLNEAKQEAILRDQKRKEGSKPKEMDEHAAATVIQSKWKKRKLALKDKLKQASWTVRIGVRLKAINPDYVRPHSRREEIKTWLRATVIWAVVIPLFITLALSVMISFVQLNIWLAFVWGRCLEKGTIDKAGGDESKCRSPQIEHGMTGFVAEVGSDVSLAIVFDVILGEVAKALARPLVKLWNYRKIDDLRYAMVMLPLVLEALSKVGLFAIVGFLFLPQWGPTGREGSYASDDCSSLIDYQLCSAAWGCQAEDVESECCKGALLCIARRVEMDWGRRQTLFEKAVKGPFMIAPFVGIVVKVIIPFVAGQLDAVVERETSNLSRRKEGTHGNLVNSTRSLAGICLKGCAGPFVRILSLIFHLDGDNVGGCGYVTRGYPFGPFRKLETSDNNQEEDAANLVEQAGSPKSGDDDDSSRLPMWRGGSVGHKTTKIAKGDKLLRNALNQVMRKEFEPLDELLDLKMSFLFVTFFAPIMPIGLIPTVVARLLELRMKLTKMCFVRRRPWPEDDKLLQRTQDGFTRMASGVAVYWHVGLVIVSYNRHLHEWPLWMTFAIWVAVSTTILVLGNFFIRTVPLGYFLEVLEVTLVEAAEAAGHVVEKVEKQMEHNNVCLSKVVDPAELPEERPEELPGGPPKVVETAELPEESLLEMEAHGTELAPVTSVNIATV